MFSSRNRIAGGSSLPTRRLFRITLKNPPGLARLYSNMCSLCSGFEPEARRIKRFSLKTCHFRSVPGTALKPRSAHAGWGARSTAENHRIFKAGFKHSRITVTARSIASLRTGCLKLRLVIKTAVYLQAIHPALTTSF